MNILSSYDIVALFLVAIGLPVVLKIGWQLNSMRKDGLSRAVQDSDSLLNKPQDKLASASGHSVHPKYRPDIDGLRAIAVLSVVAYHAFPGLLRGGFVGVDIFFVISGFLISTIIFGSLEQESFSFIEFYSRRIRRIFPALLIVLVFCYAMGWWVLLTEEFKQLGKHVAGGAGFVSNLLLWGESGYFDAAAETKPLLHLWSLGIEEQFYILWPFFLWLAWKNKLNLLTVSFVVAIISFGFNLSNHRVDGIANFYSPQTRFWELLAGSLLAYAVRHDRQILAEILEKLGFQRTKSSLVAPYAADGPRGSLLNIYSYVGTFLLIISLAYISSEQYFPGVWAILPVLGTVLIVAGGPDSWVNKVFLSNRGLVWFGIISFPLYLWHWPLLTFARIIEGEHPSGPIRVTAVSSAVILAYLTFLVIERPLRFGRRSNAIALSLFSSMVVVCGLGYGTYKSSGFVDRSVVKRNVNLDAKANYAANPRSRCDIPGISIHVVCQMYKSAQPTGRILIWGDSTAGMWLPVFLDIAKEKNIDVIGIQLNSCPAIIKARKTYFKWPKSREYCDFETKNRIFEFIKEARPDSIFLLSAWNSYSPYSNREFITDGNEADADRATTTRTIERQVPSTISRLADIARVVVFKPWPFLPASPSSEVERLPLLKGKNRIVRASFEEFKKDSELINSVLATVDPSVQFFDPAERVCDADSCSSIYKGVQIYRDRYHITQAGALLFRPDVEKLFVSE